MTKQEAYENNRKLWLEIARMVDSGELALPITSSVKFLEVKRELSKKLGLPKFVLLHACYLCDEVLGNQLNNCKNCPLSLVDGMFIKCFGDNIEGIYTRFLRATNKQEAYELAVKIATCDLIVKMPDEKELTPEEKFFNEVKGKKIRWTWWGEDQWFIPTDLLTNHEMKGHDEKGASATYKISKGFKKSECYPYWEFYKKPELKYRPYTYKEACELLGAKYKKDSRIAIICEVFIHKDIIYIDAITAKMFLEQYTWLDGSPCGVRERGQLK
jgi:hypothetical protein